MRCNTVREQLLRLTGNDKPLPLMEAARMRAHLARCPQCRREWLRLKRLNETASRLPAPALPANLRARVLAEIAAAPLPAPPAGSPDEARTRKRFRIMQRSLLVSVGLTAALGAFFLLMPHSRKTLAMGDVRKALENVNTWHLKGWKREGDKEIPWEVWGRKTPFFYHERIGAQETLDDGKERVLVFAPNPKANTQGVTLTVPSRPDAASSMGLSFVLGLARQNANAGKLVASDLNTETFIREEMVIGSDPAVQVNGQFTFEKGSPLPLRYERLHRLYHVPKNAQGAFDSHNLPENAAEKEWIAARLDGQYDAPLEDEAFHVAAPAAYRQINAVPEAVRPAMPQRSAATKSGLTMQVTQAFLDSRGGILLQFAGFVGGTNFKDAHLPFSWDTDLRSVETQDREGRYEAKNAYPVTIVARDDRNRAYIAVENLEFIRYIGDRAWLALAPVEPLKPGEPLPRQISFAMSMALNTYQPVAELNAGVSLDLLKETLDFENVELPGRAAEMDLAAFSRQYGEAKDVAGRGFATTFEPAAAAARAEAWQNLTRGALGRSMYLLQVNGGKGETKFDPEKRRVAEAMLQKAVRYTEAAGTQVSARERQRLKSNLDGIRSQFQPETNPAR